jgi:hypothetical protein
MKEGAGGMGGPRGRFGDRHSLAYIYVSTANTRQNNPYNRSTKLTFLLGELCERGRLDLVCSLPWAQGNEEDEVTQIQDRMR